MRNDLFLVSIWKDEEAGMPIISVFHHAEGIALVTEEVPEVGGKDFTPFLIASVRILASALVGLAGFGRKFVYLGGTRR